MFVWRKCHDSISSYWVEDDEQLGYDSARSPLHLKGYLKWKPALLRDAAIAQSEPEQNFSLHLLTYSSHRSCQTLSEWEQWPSVHGHSMCRTSCDMFRISTSPFTFHGACMCTCRYGIYVLVHMGLCRIVHGLTHFPPVILPSLTTLDHILYQPLAPTNTHLHSFVPNIVSHWNSMQWSNPSLGYGCPYILKL